jgi:hypothetical protein
MSEHKPKWLRMLPMVRGKRGRTCRLYRVWDQMKSRCRNPNHMHYHRYGGRGISVCQEWLDYAKFRAWAVSNGYGKGLTLDRINNDGNYEPTNCRWTTMREQIRNSSIVHPITFRGETLPIVVWSERMGADPGVVTGRIRYGWTPREALTIPKGGRRDPL